MNGSQICLYDTPPRFQVKCKITPLLLWILFLKEVCWT